MNPAASSAVALPQSRTSIVARRSAAIVLGSLLVALCAHISIPLWFTPVPITLQTFAVLFLGLVLSPEVSASALVLYLIEGIAGLPVFSPVGGSGLLHLFGPTAGYLLSYPVAAALAGILRRRIGKGGFGSSFSAAAIASAFILLAGAAWLSIVTHQSPGTIFLLAVAPFLPGDVLKLTAAAAAAVGLRRFRRS